MYIVHCENSVNIKLFNIIYTVLSTVKTNRYFVHNKKNIAFILDKTINECVLYIYGFRIIFVQAT